MARVFDFQSKGYRFESDSALQFIYAWDRWGSCERFEVEKTHITDREK